MHITDSHVLVLLCSSDGKKVVHSFSNFPTPIYIYTHRYSYSAERTIFREMIFTPVITTYCSHLGIEVLTCEDIDHTCDFFQGSNEPFEKISKHIHTLHTMLTMYTTDKRTFQNFYPLFQKFYPLFLYKHCSRSM